MKFHLVSLIADLGWLAGAGVLAYFFPLTILSVELVCLTATLALRWVERRLA